MRPMVPLFTTSILAGLLVLDLAAPRSAPATTIDLSWNACSPIQTVLQPSLPGGGIPVQYSLYASAIGQAHPHLGYQFRFALSSPWDQVPDAWRFDFAGCQTPSFLGIETRPSAFVAQTCPAFAGPITSEETRSFQYELPGTGVPANMIGGFISHKYLPRFGPHDPAQRYFLGRFVFDHTYSVNGVTTPGVDCGGFEQPVCIELVPGQCWWLNALEQPEAFDLGNRTVGVHDFCSPLPVRASTWGAIKGQYRR